MTMTPTRDDIVYATGAFVAAVFIGLVIGLVLIVAAEFMGVLLK